MGSAPPPGGSGGGNAPSPPSPGPSASNIQAAGHFDQQPGRVVVKVVSQGFGLPFTGLTDAGGYFFIPLIPAGEPFVATAIDTVTGQTRTFQGIGPAIGESVLMFFDFFSDDVELGTIAWDGGGNGISWHDPLNWNLDRLPVLTDTVTIDVPGNITVTHSQNNTSIVNLHSQEAIVLSGGSLSLAAASTLSNTFTFSSGTLNSTGKLTINGLFTWTGGSMSGLGLTIANGGLDISGATTKTLNGRTLNNIGNATWTGGTLGGSGILSNAGTLAIGGATAKTLSLSTFNNTGTVVWTGTGNLGSGSGAVFNNLASGTFEVQNDASLVFSGGAASTFNNAGVFRKSAGAGTTTIGNNITFSGGAVEVLTGTLSLANNFSTTTGGDFSVASGAVLDLTGGGSRMYVGSYTGSGGGTIRLGSGTLQIGPAGATFNFPGSLFQWSGGTLRGPAVLTNTGILNLSGSSAKTFSNLTLNNAGTVIWTGTGNLQGSSGAVFNNLASGTFDVQNDASIVWIGGIPANFNNAGLFRKSAGAGTTTFGNNVTFSGGTVEVLTGTLNLANSNTTTTGGNFSVASGAVLDLTGGASRDYIGSYTGSGAGAIRLGSGTLQIGPAGATFNFPGSLFQWSGGTLRGPAVLTNTGILNLSGSSAKTFSNLTLNNAGTVTWTGTGNINLQSGVVFNNLASGIFDVQNDAGIVWIGGIPATFNNAGLFRKSASAGTTTFGNNVAFTNASTVSVQTGVLNFVGGYTQNAGTTNLSGGNLAGSGSLNFQGGDLSGAGTVTGNVANAGQINPGGSGAAGLLTITGSYNQAATGVLNTELGGTGAGQFDQLKISGSATLTGTLNVSEINGFTPNPGDPFQIMTYGSHGTTTFATVNGPYTPIYNATNLTIQRQ